MVFDPVGGPGFADALKACRWGAHLLIIGFASGTLPKIPVRAAEGLQSSIISCVEVRFLCILAVSCWAHFLHMRSSVSFGIPSGFCLQMNEIL